MSLSREQEVKDNMVIILQKVAEGKTAREIADSLGLSDDTLKKYCPHLKKEFLANGKASSMKYRKIYPPSGLKNRFK